MVVIPYCNFVTGGFVCVTGSKANNFAIKASVQQGVGKTGESYEEFRAVVKTPSTRIHDYREPQRVVGEGRWVR